MTWNWLLCFLMFLDEIVKHDLIVKGSCPHFRKCFCNQFYEILCKNLIDSLIELIMLQRGPHSSCYCSHYNLNHRTLDSIPDYLGNPDPENHCQLFSSFCFRHSLSNFVFLSLQNHYELPIIQALHLLYLDDPTETQPFL